MIGTSRIPAAVLRWTAASALAGALAAAGPNAASAQTAKNLNCNKCVGAKEIDKKAVSKGKIKKAAVTFGKLQDAVEDNIKQDRTFYVTLDSNGAEATLVTQGPLRMFARCLIDDGGFDRIQIVQTSSVGGWFKNEDTSPRAAGEEVIVGGQDVPNGTSGYIEDDAADAIAPDGSAIVPFPLVGLGFNVFGHFCLVHGRAGAITGTL